MKLHLYGQEASHAEAWIVGDRESLEKLRDACEQALAKQDAAFSSDTADGESYNTFVVCIEDRLTWEEVSLPYPGWTWSAPCGLVSLDRRRELRKACDDS